MPFKDPEKRKEYGRQRRQSAKAKQDRLAWEAANPTYHQSWRAEHRENQRKANLKALYGLTLVQYEAILVSQGGVCAICSKPPKTGRNLDVDHCHVTNRIRGLLCNNCNRGIGHLKDDPDLLERAATYLRGSNLSSSSTSEVQPCL